MQLALVEPTPQMSFEPLKHRYERYLGELPEDERDELQRRVGLFIHWRDQILKTMRVTAG
jgi:hypothetical protein